jgi:heterodisulfide reductase subunit D
MPFFEQKTEDLIRCMKCGNCMQSCPVYQVTGRETGLARGRLRLLKAALNGELELTDGLRESLFTCLNCDACFQTCPPGVPVSDLIAEAKAELRKHGKPLSEAHDLIRCGIERESNPFNQPKGERGAWLPEDLKHPKPAPYMLHAGCSISYASNRIGKAVIRILQKAGVDFTMMGDEELCCGDPYVRIGEVEMAEELRKSNQEAWKKYGVEYVITPCAGCIGAFKQRYSNSVEFLHTVQLFSKLIDEGKLSFEKPFKKRVIYFDGCDIGRHSEIYDEPRKVLAAIPELTLLEMPKNREEGMCCGGPLLGAYPDYARAIAAARVREAQALGADMMAVACPTCLLNLKEGANTAGIRMDIQDVTAIALRAGA